MIDCTNAVVRGKSGMALAYGHTNSSSEELQRKIAEKAGYRLVGHRLELYGVPLDSKSDRQK